MMCPQKMIEELLYADMSVIPLSQCNDLTMVDKNIIS